MYRVGKILGRGAFGKVNLCKHKLSDEFIAMKVMKKAFIQEKKSRLKLM